jgi:hypothetical protein
MEPRPMLEGTLKAAPLGEHNQACTETSRGASMGPIRDIETAVAEDAEDADALIDCGVFRDRTIPQAVKRRRMPMRSRPLPDNPVLVVTADPELLKRIDTLLHQLPLDTPGLPSPATPITVRTPKAAANIISWRLERGDGFSLAITDSIAAAQAIWSADPQLSILHIGLPDAHTLEDTPSHQLLALPASPHPILLQQAVLLLADRSATERQLRTALKDQEEEAVRAEAQHYALRSLFTMLHTVDNDLADRANRIVSLVARTAELLNLNDTATLMIAARMSMLGMAELPEATRIAIRTGKPLQESEERARRLQTRTGCNILNTIPGTEAAAELLSLQAPDRSGLPQQLHPRSQLEATILRLAMEVDIRLCAGFVPVTAAEDIVANPPPGLRAAVRDMALMNALTDACLQERDVRVDTIRASQLRSGMILYRDVYTTRGVLLVRKNQKLHPPLVRHLKQFAAGVGIVEPVAVIVPAVRRMVRPHWSD